MDAKLEMEFDKVIEAIKNTNDIEKVKDDFIACITAFRIGVGTILSATEKHTPEDIKKDIEQMVYNAAKSL